MRSYPFKVGKYLAHFFNLPTVAKRWNQHNIPVIPMDMGPVFSSGVHYLYNRPVLWWKILYLHDKLGFRSLYHNYADFSRAGHLLALWFIKHPKPGTGVRKQSQNYQGTEDILVALQYDPFISPNYFNGVLGIPTWKDE